jgi:hypothetical protein
MSNYWNKLSPLHGTVTKRQSHATGGRVGLKDGKSVKTLVAGFVGKAKDWPGAKAVKKLNKKGKTRK